MSVKFFVIIYTAVLVAVFEIIFSEPELWWLSVILWGVNAGLLYYVARFRRGQARAALPSLIILALLSAILLFIETAAWRQAVAILGSILMGYYLLLLLDVAASGVFKRFRDLLGAITVLLAAGLGLSGSVFLRIPWYLSLIFFILVLVAFNAHLPGGKARFFGGLKWLSILVSSELFMVALILPINIFSRAALVGLAFHLSTVLTRTQLLEAPKKSLIRQQVAVTAVLSLVILLTSRWV